jgi:signal transduction histidine kinase/PAS domain-containing protein
MDTRSDIGTPHARCPTEPPEPGAALDGARPGNAGPGAGAGVDTLDLAAVVAALPGTTVVFAADAPDFTVLAATDAVLAAARRPREAVVGRPLAEAFPTTDPDGGRGAGLSGLRGALEAAVRTRAPQRLVHQRYDVPGPDGTWEERYWDTVNTPVLGPDGAVRCVLHLSEDTTERARLAAEVSAERERLRTLILQLPAPAALHLGPDHRFALVNDAFRRLSAGRDVTGLTPREAFPSLGGQGIYEAFDAVYASGVPWVAEERHVRYDRAGAGRAGDDAGDAGAEDAWFNVRFEPVRDAEGRVVGIVNFSFDVTEQVRARIRAERLRALTAALAEARTVGAVADAILEYGMAVVGADAGAVCRVAPDAPGSLEILRQRGYGVPALAEWARFPLVPPTPEWDAHVAAAVRSGEPVLTVGLAETAARFPAVRTLAEQTGYLSWLAVPFVVEGRAVGGFGLAFRGDRRASEPDREALVSMSRQCAVALERVRLDEAERAARAAAEAARDAAERANRAKSEFLAVMSHELRTPLNAIGGYADLLALGIHGPVTPQQRDALGRIQRSGRHLLGLINEVLNYAKIDAGSVEFALRPVRVAEAVVDAEALVAPQLRVKGLGYAWSGCDPSLAVVADPDKLQQVLLNLFSNAVKFTDARDGVPGRVDASCDVGGDGRVRIRVRDTGVGIPPEKLDAIFEPFVQVRSDLTRPHEGTGLGLAISRDLARGMGGELTVESAPDVGSTFTLTLPRA